MNEKKKQLLKEIFRFLLIGGIATLADYIVYFLFSEVILANAGVFNIPISTFLGFTTGLIINWIFSSRFVFNYKDKTTKKQFLLYLALCLFGLIITEIGTNLAKPIYGLFYIDIIISFDFWKLFVKCCLTLLVLVINYLGRKYIVFKKPSNEEI